MSLPDDLRTTATYLERLAGVAGLNRGPEPSPLADAARAAADRIEALEALAGAARDLLDNHETNARHLRLAQALDNLDALERAQSNDGPSHPS